jgi:NAD+ kinase
MGMPNNLLMVRHGPSEPNKVQKRFKEDPTAQAPEGFFDRHDSLMRLNQDDLDKVRMTGEWIKREFPNGFDRCSTSPHIRAVETAGTLALGGKWRIDDRWRERDWGEYGILNEEQREEQYRHSRKLKNQNKWYWCPPGGESLATGVRLRFEDILDTYHRELNGKDAIAVTHGEKIDVGSFVLERLTVIEWLARNEDPKFRIPNCFVLQYSRTNPETGRMENHANWRRGVCVWDPNFSWDDGNWVRIEHKQYSDEELLQMAEQYPPLL